VSDPGKELSNFGTSITQSAQGIVSDVGSFSASVGSSFKQITNKPLPLIEAIALTYMLGPSGLALADTAGAAIIASAAVSAANGGNIQQIALSAASAYAAANAGNMAGNLAASTAMDYGFSGTTASVLKTIVTSASAPAAAAALSGKSLDQILISGAAGAVSGAVQSQLATLKNSDGSAMFDKGSLSSTLVATASNAAAKAILGGKSIGDAIAQSSVLSATSWGINQASAAIKDTFNQLTTKSTALTDAVSQANTLQTTATNYYNQTLSPLEATAQQEFDSLNTIAGQFTTEKAQYDSQFATGYTPALNAYNSAQANWTSGLNWLASQPGYNYSSASWYFNNSTSGYTYNRWIAPWIAAGNNLTTQYNLLLPTVDALNKSAAQYNSGVDVFGKTMTQLSDVKTTYQGYVDQVTTAADTAKSLSTDVNNLTTQLGQQTAELNANEATAVNELVKNAADLAVNQIIDQTNVNKLVSPEAIAQYNEDTANGVSRVDAFANAQNTDITVRVGDMPESVQQAFNSLVQSGDTPSAAVAIADQVNKMPTVAQDAFNNALQDGISSTQALSDAQTVAALTPAQQALYSTAYGQNNSVSTAISNVQEYATLDSQQQHIFNAALNQGTAVSGSLENAQNFAALDKTQQDIVTSSMVQGGTVANAFTDVQNYNKMSPNEQSVFDAATKEGLTVNQSFTNTSDFTGLNSTQQEVFSKALTAGVNTTDALSAAPTIAGESSISQETYFKSLAQGVSNTEALSTSASVNEMAAKDQTLFSQVVSSGVDIRDALTTTPTLSSQSDIAQKAYFNSLSEGQNNSSALNTSSSVNAMSDSQQSMFSKISNTGVSTSDALVAAPTINSSSDIAKSAYFDSLKSGTDSNAAVAALHTDETINKFSTTAQAAFSKAYQENPDLNAAVASASSVNSMTTSQQEMFSKVLDTGLTTREALTSAPVLTSASDIAQNSFFNSLTEGKNSVAALNTASGVNSLSTLNQDYYQSGTNLGLDTASALAYAPKISALSTTAQQTFYSDAKNGVGLDAAFTSASQINNLTQSQQASYENAISKGLDTTQALTVANNASMLNLNAQNGYIEQVRSNVPTTTADVLSTTLGQIFGTSTAPTNINTPSTLTDPAAIAYYNSQMVKPGADPVSVAATAANVQAYNALDPVSKQNYESLAATKGFTPQTAMAETQSVINEFNSQQEANAIAAGKTSYVDNTGKLNILVTGTNYTPTQAPDISKASPGLLNTLKQFAGVYGFGDADPNAMLGNIWGTGSTGNVSAPALWAGGTADQQLAALKALQVNYPELSASDKAIVNQIAAKVAAAPVTTKPVIGPAGGGGNAGAGATGESGSPGAPSTGGSTTTGGATTPSATPSSPSDIMTVYQNLLNSFYTGNGGSGTTAPVLSGTSTGTSSVTSAVPVGQTTDSKGNITTSFSDGSSKTVSSTGSLINSTAAGTGSKISSTATGTGSGTTGTGAGATGTGTGTTGTGTGTGTGSGSGSGTGTGTGTGTGYSASSYGFTAPQLQSGTGSLTNLVGTLGGGKQATLVGLPTTQETVAPETNMVYTPNTGAGSMPAIMPQQFASGGSTSASDLTGGTYNPIGQTSTGIDHLTPAIAAAHKAQLLGMPTITETASPLFATQYSQSPIQSLSETVNPAKMAEGGGLPSPTYNYNQTGFPHMNPSIVKAKGPVGLMGLPGHAYGDLSGRLVGMPPGHSEGGEIEGHNPEFYSEGGLQHFVQGGGTGTSDSVPAMLANGEFVIPADVVSGLGNGSNDSGAQILDQFLKAIRAHKQSNKPEDLPPDSKGPLGYLLEAKRKA